MLELMGDVEGEEGRRLVRSGERYFKVGSLLWQAAERHQAGSTRSALSSWLDLDHPVENRSGDEHPVMKALDRLLQAAGQAAAPSRVRGRVDVDAGRIVAPLGALLRPLISASPIYFVLLVVLMATNVLALAAMPVGHGSSPLRDAVLIAAAMFAIMALHEVGHSAAASALGCRTRRIGLGLLLGMPVFYADVSEIWRLGPVKRVVVNLAGVQIQLAIGVLLALWVFSGGRGSGVVAALAAVNLLSVVVNLMPFAKLDGYWIVADLLDVHDLHSRGWARIKDLFKRGTIRAGDGKEIAVLAYAVGLAAFTLYAAAAFADWLWRIGSAVATDPHHGLSKVLGTPLSWLAFAYAVVRLVRAAAHLAVRLCRTPLEGKTA